MEPSQDYHPKSGQVTIRNRIDSANHSLVCNLLQRASFINLLLTIEATRVCPRFDDLVNRIELVVAFHSFVSTDESE